MPESPGTAASDPRLSSISAPDLSVIIPTLDEGSNIGLLIKDVQRVLTTLGVCAEIIVVDGGSRDGTIAAARQSGARVIQQEGHGYGAALRRGFAVASGAFVLTLDDGFTHYQDL